jgi:hypothetical protein
LYVRSAAFEPLLKVMSVIGSETVAKMKTESANGEAKTPSKMGMVREGIKSLGEDSKPQELQDYIREHFGREIPANIISNYKSQLKRKMALSSGLGRGRKAGGDASFSLAELEAVRGLVSRFGIDKVKQLVSVFST